MTRTATEIPSAGWPRPRLFMTLAVIAVISYINGTLPSFHPAIAPIKLAVGLLHFVAIGYSTSTLLGLARPRMLAPAQDALLGQLVCVAYVYARSALCDLTGLPGISSLETFGAEAFIAGLAFARRGSSINRPGASQTNAVFSAGMGLLWLGWLIAMAIQKLDLFFTPSSDPDIHAYYAKIFLERGRIYYDLLPSSDAWMVYPSGFGSLNFVLGRLSGLHPVQLVNIGAYLQLTLFAGASFSVLANRSAGRRALLATALVHFGFVYVAFNAVFVEHRAFLEGTPRLAHSALLFFPLLFAAQHRRSLARHAWLWSIPGVAVAIGMCINPAHAPAAILIGAISLIAFGSQDESPVIKTRRWLTVAASAALVLGIILSIDPFYRSLVAQQSAEEGVEAATDLTGGALRGDFDLDALATDAVPAALHSLIQGPSDSSVQKAERCILLTALACAAALMIARRAQSNRAAARQLLFFSAASVGVVLIHGVWSEFTPRVTQSGVLQARLLVQYTEALQQQINLLVFGVMPTLIICMLSQCRRDEAGAPTSSNLQGVAILASFALAALLLYSVLRTDQSSYYSVMRSSPLGEVAASDVEFARMLHEHVPEDQRVLLPGRVRRTSGEHWIFTTDAGRGIALFSTVRTSFFLGLDGAAFTADAYQAHVKPPNFDPVWLRAQDTTWLVESGNFPTRILSANYERVAGTAHAMLWRLRD